jgi:polysaccharide export outer membrane protein
MKTLLFVLLFALPVSAVALPFQTPPASQAPADFVIGLEDVLAVNVWKEAELSVREIVVRPDGKISLPLIGDIQASGSTTKQLQERIAERLKEFVTTPTVTVSVLRIASQSVSIVGQVPKPGVYYLGSPLTVLELLARAGGCRDDANTKKIAIIRKDGDQTRHFLFNYKEVSKGQNLKQNIVLRGGDVVIVP